jgi:hypothetical protein
MKGTPRPAPQPSRVLYRNPTTHRTRHTTRSSDRAAPRHGSAALGSDPDRGFYRTSDSGASWQDANFGETGFTAGKKIKPIIVDGDHGVFALIDRGTRADEGENPLYRLESRGAVQRWRFGLSQLLR